MPRLRKVLGRRDVHERSESRAKIREVHVIDDLVASRLIDRVENRPNLLVSEGSIDVPLRESKAIPVGGTAVFVHHPDEHNMSLPDAARNLGQKPLEIARETAEQVDVFDDVVGEDPHL